MISAFFAPNRVKTTVQGLIVIMTTLGGVANTLQSVDPVTHQRGKPDWVATGAGIGGGLMLMFAYDKPKKKGEGDEEEDEQAPAAEVEAKPEPPKPSGP